MTHLDDRMLLADLDTTPHDELPDTVSLPRRILARIPELEGLRARIAGQLFGVDLPAPRIGRFRLQEKLGEGGMGQVFAAHDDTLDRRVAVKILQAERLATRDGRARMLREAQALARLSHPNVVQVFEVGEHDDQIYVAMELVDGIDLARWLTREPRSWRAVLSIFIAAGHGLQAAHEAGLVHRDFKPANVIVGADGRARVLDFGLARAAQTISDPTAAAHTTSPILHDQLTMTGAVHGTPVYLAPELLSDPRADARADQYAFCVALYEGLHGVRPHRADTLGALTRAKLRGDILPPPAGSKVPAWLHAAVLRGLAVDPGQRWPSMRALLAELARDRITARRRTLSLALGGVLFATAGVAGVHAMRSDAAAELASATALAEQARAHAAEQAADASAREHALVLQVRASESAIRRAQDLASSPARAREAATLAAAAVRDAQTTGAPTTPALRALVTALTAPRLTRELQTPDLVRSAQYAADEQVLVTHGHDWTLRLWDTRGAELAALPRVHAARVDPRGRLVTLGDDGLAVRDPHTGAATQQLGPGQDTLELSPDGRLAAVHNDHHVDLYDLERGALLLRLPHAADQLAFSADNRRLVSARGGVAKLWSLPDGRLLGTLPTTIDAPQMHTRVAITPDGTRVAVASVDSDVYLWDTTGKPRLLERIVGHTHVSQVLQFAADGRTLLSAGGDGLIFLWNAADARVLLRLGGARGRWYQAATLSPDGQRILAADAEGVLHIWDTSTGEALQHLASDRGEITDLRLLADGQRILTASASGRASEWSFPTSIAATATIPGPTTAADHLGDRLALLAPDGSMQLHTLTAHPEPLALSTTDPTREHLRLAPDGSTLLTVNHAGQATLFDATTGQPRCTIAATLHIDNRLCNLAYTAGDTLTGVTEDGAVQVWSRADCQPLRTQLPAGPGWPAQIFTTPTGPTLIARDEVRLAKPGPDGLIQTGIDPRLHTLVDPTGIAAALPLDLGEHEALSAGFAPDLTQLTLIGRNGLARVHDARTGAPLGELPGLDGWVTRALYAPDGATLLTLGGGHAAHLWRTSDRSLLARLEVGETPTHAAFSRDGARLLIADARGQVGLWDAHTHEFAGTLARLEARPQLVAFSADDQDVLLVGPIHGALRVPATVTGILAASRGLTD